MSVDTRSTGRDTTTVRYALIAVLIGIAFFMSYNFAVAKSDTGFQGGEQPDQSGLAAVPGSGGCGAGGGGGCCGGAGSGEPVEGAAAVEGDVQRVFVDASRGFDPNVIRAQAGIPLEITFSEGYGCMAQVMSRELGFFEDLTTGSKTITLPALQAGEYGFSCGMEMVFGTIVVE